MKVPSRLQVKRRLSSRRDFGFHLQNLLHLYPLKDAMSHKTETGRLGGFLNIEETEMKGTFCRRYFVLDRANKKLSYYMDNPAILPESWRNPVGEVYLQYINTVFDARKMRPKVPFCFVVSVAGRQYFLQAEDLKSMKQWIDAINNASKITVPPSGRCARGAEWHAGDLRETSYVTEIAGGVVCKIPMQGHEDSDSGSDVEEWDSSSSGQLSSSSSLSRHLNTVGGVPMRTNSPHHTTPTNTSASLYKAGYAVKQGARLKNWKRRFFVLNEQGFSYFKSEQESQPIRTIPWMDIVESRQSEGSHVNRDNLFEVVTNKRIFYVQCDSPTEMHSWLHEIQAALYKRRGTNKSEEGKSDPQKDGDDTRPQTVWV